MIGSIVVAFVGGALGLDYALAEKGLIQFYLTQDYATVGIVTLADGSHSPRSLLVLSCSLMLV
jgi:hypothetical protein